MDRIFASWRTFALRHPRIDHTFKAVGYVACFVLILNSTFGHGHWLYGLLGGVVLTLNLAIHLASKSASPSPD